MKKTYTIEQKLIQTDYYEVEADSAEEALSIYLENPGVCDCSGSTSGWRHSESDHVVVIE